MRTLPRRLRTPVLALLALTTYVLLFLVARAPDPWDADAQLPLPPLYEAYHAAERALPQHALDARFPDGQDAKFFWVANHAPSECVVTWVRAGADEDRCGVGECAAGAYYECVFSV